MRGNSILALGLILLVIAARRRLRTSPGLYSRAGAMLAGSNAATVARAHSRRHLAVEVVPATTEDRATVRHLTELYLYDLSEFEGTDVNDDGLFTDGRAFDRYWSRPSSYPFLIRVNGKIAGFALTQRGSRVSGDDDTMEMTEFFILRNYRRRGIGKKAATEIFNRFPGKWEIRELARNRPAQIFWRQVIADHTGGRYVEIRHAKGWPGVIQRFDTSARVLPTHVDAAIPPAEAP